MVKLIAQIIMLLLAMTITKSICEAAGNKWLSKLATMATVLVICATVVQSPPIKQLSKTAADVGTLLDKLANGKPAQYNVQRPVSPLNPLPDNQIPIWHFGPSGQPQK